MGTVKYSGPVASFHCPTEAEIRSLKVHFSPKQLGEGTPSPENVREIVGWDEVEVSQSQNNLFNENSIIYSCWTDDSGNVNTGAKYGCISEKIRPNSTSFTLIAMAERPNSMSIIEYDANGNFLRRTHGNQVQYVKVNATWSSTVYIAVQISDSNGGTTITPEYVTQRKMMLIEGIDNPITYEPYHGSTTNYEFGVLGKNKLDPTWESGGINVSTGEASADSASIRLKNMIKVFPSQTYKLSWSSTGRNVYRFAYKKDGTFSRYLGLQSANSQSITLNADEYYLWLYQYQNINEPENIQLELGSTATEYTPYDPNKTVYGGWVDLVSGEVCEEWKGVDSETLNWSAYSATRCSTGDLSNLIKTPDSYSSIAKLIGEQVIAGRMSMDLTNYPNAIACNPSGSLIKYYGGEFPQGKIVYELATSNTYHLAPTQLQTFLGHNNVWSNADYVEVEYDLHETQNILARKQFIIANQPHIVKPAAAPLQNFVTDMAAPLKECKVYFSPVQEGTGDPSPENVRAISGWTGAEVYRGYEYLSNVQITTGKTLNSSGIEATESGMAVTDYIPVEVGHTYTLKFTSTTAGRTRRIFGYSALKEPISQLASVSWATVDNTFSMNAEIPSGTSYIRACYYNNDLNKTLTEPSTVIILPIDWTDSAGTIYGGYVDLVTGEVWVEWKYIDLTTADWTQFSVGTSVITVSLFPGTISNRNNGFCNILPMVSNPNISGIEGVDWNNGRLNLCLSVSREILTLADFKTWLQTLKDDGITPCVVAKYGESALLTTLTPTILKTLRGTNNIWSNANGNIDLSYWTH